MHPAAQRQTFSYSIPSELTVNVGQAVYVPFGQKTIQGLVLELTDFPAFEATRDIIGIIDSQPLLSTKQILLAKWLSDYYLSPLFDALALMLPPGFETAGINYHFVNGSRILISQHSLRHSTKPPGTTKTEITVRSNEIELLLGRRNAPRQLISSTGGTRI